MEIKIQSKSLHKFGPSRGQFKPAASLRGEETPATNCKGGWMGPRAGLDTVANGKILC